MFTLDELTTILTALGMAQLRLEEQRMDSPTAEIEHLSALRAKVRRLAKALMEEEKARII